MRSISRNDRNLRHYQRKYTISTHALERFRERVDEEFRHRDDVDLGHLLDEKLRHSQERHQVKDPRAPDAATLLYTIEMRTNGRYYVVIRDETAITILDPSMARRNFPAVWMPVAFNSPFGALQTIKLPANTSAVASVASGVILTTPTTNAHAVATTTTPPIVEPQPPLEIAGVRYARALKHKRDCELAVLAARLALQAADDALRRALSECDAASHELTELAKV